LNRLRKMKILGLLLLFALLGFSSPESAVNTKGEMLWSSDRFLVWSDFKKKASDYNAGDAALTASSIQTQTSMMDKLLKISVTAKFYPYQSWSLKNKQSDSLLKHEQLHFDITELYARKTRKALLENIIYKKDYNKIGNVVSKYTKEWNQIQDLYDLESNHNRNLEGQKKWEKFISEELERYSDFEQTELVIMLK